MVESIGWIIEFSLFRIDVVILKQKTAKRMSILIF
jgi:hypothetical protein